MFFAGDKVLYVGRRTITDFPNGDRRGIVTHGDIHSAIVSFGGKSWRCFNDNLKLRGEPVERIQSSLPHDSAERKTYPLYSGLMAYFPAALAAVANHSWNGNQKHNPGQELHWARGKSEDHADALLRHVMEGDYEGAAWRALALLQMQLESEGAPIAPGAK